jgi:hypothetical protein
MDEKEALLKEFETLRQEIMDHQNRRERLFLFTIAAFGVVLGFVLKLNDLPFIIVSFVPYIIILNFCQSNIIQSRHIITIGTYIRLFIANHFEYALQWEIIWDKLTKQKDSEDKKREAYLKGGGYWFYFCLIALIAYCIGIISLAYFEKFKFQPFIYPFIILHFLSCTLCYFFGVKKIHWANLTKKAREKSNEKLLKYKSQEESDLNDPEESGSE